MKKEVQSVTERVVYTEEFYTLACNVYNGREADFKFYINGTSLTEPTRFNKQRLDAYNEMLTALSKSL